MLLDRYTSVMNVDDRVSLEREVIRFAIDLGFDFVSAMVTVDHANHRCATPIPEFTRYATVM